MSDESKKKGYQWRFFRSGGFDQVRIETADDLRHLGELDQKLWSVLACPTSGLEFDTRTLQVLDSDGDGRIRAPELLQACQWALERLNNPDALATVEVMQKSREILRKAFDPILDEPVPERLINCIRATHPVSKEGDSPPQRQARISHFRANRAKPALAWAAALALIVGGLAAYIGNHALHRRPFAPVPITAVDAFLDEALDNTVSGAVFTKKNPGSNEAVREIMPMLSFRSQDARFCREYEELANGGEVRYGVACRENGHWRDIDIIAHQKDAGEKATSGQEHYTPAMGEDNAGNLDGLIDAFIQGAPFGPDDEARLIRNGWKTEE